MSGIAFSVANTKRVMSYSVITIERRVIMMEKIKIVAVGAIDVGIKLISLSIVLQIIFGSKVAFLTGNVIGSILDIVWTLGNAGLAGLIAAGIIWKLLDKDITNELSK